MDFDVEKTVTYWVEGAQYDIGVAKSLFQKRKYPYALFFGHLALEKLLKALVVRNTKKHAPYTHSLPLLASKLNLTIPDKTEKQLLRFMEFYLEARYPEEQRVYYKKCTKEFAQQNLKDIKKVFKWLKEQL